MHYVLEEVDSGWGGSGERGLVGNNNRNIFN